MIHDVDESLRALVKREVTNGGDVDITFDAPTKDWAARRNTPTLDLYLYDIREDVSRREAAIDVVRDPETGLVRERQPLPRRFKLSYLVTAWTQRSEDEHRLLSAMLSCFIKHEWLPPDVLDGALVAQQLPCYVTIALPPPQDRSISDVWSALGGELKPSLDLVVVAPFEVRRITPAAPAVLATPSLAVVGSGGQGEMVEPSKGPAARRRRGGGSGPVEPSRGAGAELEGLDALPEDVARSAHRVGQREGPGRGVDHPAPPSGRRPLERAEPAAREDVVTPGAERRPSRIVRIRSVDRP